MHTFIILIFSFFSLLLNPQPGLADGFLFGNEGSQQIVINNRVLAHVNGKPITVLDVMKKMDMLFLKQFPEYTSSSQARFQYYSVNWRRMLQELIDKELILADAEESKIPITPGDVRQEMESLFGPNIIANLDKIGLTFDEAFKIVQGDLTLRRMMMVRVNAKALRSITPQMIREAYEEFAKKNIKQESWHYQVITIRNSDAKSGEETAQSAFKMLTEDRIALTELSKSLQAKNLLGKSSVSVSDPFYHTEADVNEVIKEAFKDLTPGSFSPPLAQKSRTDKSTIFRILFLKEKIPCGAIPYNEIENQLKDELYDKATMAESEAYLKKLHRHYAISDTYIEDTIPKDFQPFTLR